MKGSGLLELTPRDGATEVAYRGEVQVGGMIASVGQRLVETTAKFVIRKFFDKLSEQVGAAETGGGSPASEESPGRGPRFRPRRRRSGARGGTRRPDRAGEKRF